MMASGAVEGPRAVRSIVTPARRVILVGSAVAVVLATLVAATAIGPVATPVGEIVGAFGRALGARRWQDRTRSS